MAKAKNERNQSQFQDDGPARAVGGKQVNIGLIDQPQLDEMSREMQAPQSVNDKHGHTYDNDTKGWVRGMGKYAPYPYFDKHKSGSK
jgi:hypothetical protein